MRRSSVIRMLNTSSQEMPVTSCEMRCRLIAN